MAVAMVPRDLLSRSTVLVVDTALGVNSGSISVASEALVCGLRKRMCEASRHERLWGSS